MKKLLPILSAVVLLAFNPATALASTLALSPSSGTFNQGCNFSLNVLVDTAGVDTDGTDAILLYDPTRVTATTISNGTIYPDYPGNNIDSANGKITISGLSSVSSAFTGQGTLATINFTVPAEAPAGAFTIKFDFDPNDKAKTTDSNVVQRGTVADVLNSVTNGNYIVGTGVCGQGQSTIQPKGAISTPSAQIPLKKTLPEGGTKELTFTMTIVGSVLTVLGILGLALL